VRVNFRVFILYYNMKNDFFLIHKAFLICNISTCVYIIIGSIVIIFFLGKGNSIFWIFPYKKQVLQCSLPEIEEWWAENILHAFQISPQVIFPTQCWSTRYVVAKLNNKNNYTNFVSVLIRLLYQSSITFSLLSLLRI
jgi:hypothetical protein